MYCTVLYRQLWDDVLLFNARQPVLYTKALLLGVMMMMMMMRWQEAGKSSGFRYRFYSIDEAMTTFQLLFAPVFAEVRCHVPAVVQYHGNTK